MAYIEFRNIRKSYDGENLVLKDLNLQVNEGELVTLLGPSGCGKSTLLRSLAGFESIDGGSIHINGQDVTSRRGNGISGWFFNNTRCSQT